MFFIILCKVILGTVSDVNCLTAALFRVQEGRALLISAKVQCYKVAWVTSAVFIRFRSFRCALCLSGFRKLMFFLLFLLCLVLTACAHRSVSPRHTLLVRATSQEMVTLCNKTIVVTEQLIYEFAHLGFLTSQYLFCGSFKII